jgi:hypothetical protein
LRNGGRRTGLLQATKSVHGRQHCLRNELPTLGGGQCELIGAIDDDPRLEQDRGSVRLSEHDELVVAIDTRFRVQQLASLARRIFRVMPPTREPCLREAPRCGVARPRIVITKRGALSVSRMAGAGSREIPKTQKFMLGDHIPDRGPGRFRGADRGVPVMASAAATFFGQDRTPGRAGMEHGRGNSRAPANPYARRAWRSAHPLKRRTSKQAKCQAPSLTRSGDQRARAEGRTCAAYPSGTLRLCSGLQ